MNKEFIPYEQALELKELGFDEPCFGFWTENSLTKIGNLTFPFITTKDTSIAAPLYQQAFRWFREKYGYHSEPIWDNDNGTYWFFSITKIGDIINDAIDLEKCDIYEESELECLKKLIEIVNKNGY